MQANVQYKKYLQYNNLISIYWVLRTVNHEESKEYLGKDVEYGILCTLQVKKKKQDKLM